MKLFISKKVIFSDRFITDFENRTAEIQKNYLKKIHERKDNPVLIEFAYYTNIEGLTDWIEYFYRGGKAKAREYKTISILADESLFKEN